LRHRAGKSGTNRQPLAQQIAAGRTAHNPKLKLPRIWNREHKCARLRIEKLHRFIQNQFQQRFQLKCRSKQQRDLVHDFHLLRPLF